MRRAVGAWSVLGCLAALAMTPVAARAAVTLDGSLDGTGYGSPIASDAAGDLQGGISTWDGVAWTDLRDLYATSDGTNLYVYSSLPGYSAANSHGSFGLAIDVKNTAAGGTTDPWGNAITFAQASLPDYFVRGNTPADGGWTELRTWNGSDWNTGGGTDVSGSTVRWQEGGGIEFSIPLASLGAGPGDAINMMLFGTQTSGGKGAYDTVPSDNQSSDWDVATTESAYATYVVPTPEPASLGLVGVGLVGLTARRRRRQERMA